MRSTVNPRNAKLSGNFEGGCMGAFQADIGWRSNRGWLSLVVAMAVGLMLAAAILSGHSAPTSVVNVRSASLQTAATSNDSSSPSWLANGSAITASRSSAKPMSGSLQSTDPTAANYLPPFGPYLTQPTNVTATGPAG